MAQEANGVAARAARIAEPIAETLGLTLWDVRFVREGVHWYLRFWIDRAEGIDLDDCERMSRALDAPLDEADLIDEAYHLEVCSPGIARELTRPEHFRQYIGSTVAVRRKHPAVELIGQLTSYESQQFTLQCGDETHAFTRKECAWVRLQDSLQEAEASSLPLQEEHKRQNFF